MKDRRGDSSVTDVVAHEVMHVAQVGSNFENYLVEGVNTDKQRESLKLDLMTLIHAVEQCAATIALVIKWSGNLPSSVVDLIPFQVVIDAEANSRERDRQD